MKKGTEGALKVSELLIGLLLIVIHTVVSLAYALNVCFKEHCLLSSLGAVSECLNKVALKYDSLTSGVQ